jgi:CheY-like chemotaxis protein
VTQLTNPSKKGKISIPNITYLSVCRNESNYYQREKEGEGEDESKNGASHVIRSSLQYTILLVDDESDVILTLKKGLEDNGFAKVDAFNDPLLALSSFKTSFYDLMLLDVKMPKMNGFELFREIERREKKKNIKACFITAHEVYYESLKKEFPTLNVGCFITKPVDIDDLIRRIKTELEPQQQ